LATLLVHDNLLLAGGMYIQFDPLLGPNSLYVSKDSGASWEVSCPNFCVHQLQQNTRGDLYAATDISQLPTRGGVYRSLDNGATWEFAGLDSRDVWGITFDDDGYCFAATQSYSPENNGLFRSLNPIPWAVSPSPAIAHSFTLFQNYPNPFNPSTKIRFSLPRASNVLLRIYNTLGQEVTQILSQHLNAGSYTTEWNASEFPSGIYYCRLEADGFVETKKLVLMK
jgi:hypothetical protein